MGTIGDSFVVMPKLLNKQPIYQWLETPYSLCDATLMHLYFLFLPNIQQRVAVI